MSIESKQIEKNVEAKLLELNIEYSVVYIGERKRENWDCDAWNVTFKKKDKSFSTEYYTGLGRRTFKNKIAERNEPTSNKKSVHYAQWVEHNIVPVKPNDAGVLHSLCMDSQAIDDSFDNWASGYGYDADSLKAFNIYQQCCKIAKEMLQVFSYKDISKFNELLQDY